MRWLFAETAAELESRAALVERARRFWASFGRREPEIARALSAGESLAELGTWLQGEIAAVHPELQFELGRCEEGRRLVITPEAKLGLAPLVTAVIELAPRFDGWSFLPYRPAEPFERAQLLLQGRAGGDVRGWHVIISRVDRRIRLRFLSPQCRRSQDDAQVTRAYLAASILLGEQVANAWIESVLVDPLPTRKAFLLFGKTVRVGTDSSVAVEELAERVRRLVAELTDELPSVPHQIDLERAVSADTPIGHVYQLNRSPQEMQRGEAAGYPGQTDLLVASHCLKPLLPAVRCAGFSSKTLSRAGETFCYLKVDGRQGLGPGFADRAGLEDALDAALGPNQLGCTVGGGTGVHYSYVELALRDLERAAVVIRERLSAAAIPKHSWLLFHDAELADEWIGIFPDTPAPPPFAKPDV